MEARMPFDGSEFGRRPEIEKIEEVITLLANENQWCKGRLRSADGRYCMVGAMRAADAYPLLKPAILQAISEVTGRNYAHIQVFNDQPATTHALVLAVLYKARRNIIAGRLDPEPQGIKGRYQAALAWCYELMS